MFQKWLQYTENVQKMVKNGLRRCDNTKLVIICFLCESGKFSNGPHDMILLSGNTPKHVRNCVLAKSLFAVVFHISCATQNYAILRMRWRHWKRGSILNALKKRGETSQSVNYDGEGLWRPIQIPNNGRKKKSRG